jgi:hypothetical protein
LSLAIVNFNPKMPERFFPKMPELSANHYLLY